MRDADKERCIPLVYLTKLLFPDCVNLVPIVMSALNGRANPNMVREWIEDDARPPYRCGICMHYYDECDCSKTGRR